jgi:sugar O-acyltransferase (sialic acid O-acetyltransferase NeuD family)
MTDFGIFGTSGFAREAGDIAHALGLRPIYFARNADELNAWTSPDEVALQSELGRYGHLKFAIGIGDNKIRQRLASELANTVAFGNLIHPNASFGHRQRERIESRRGVIVCAGVRMTNNITVGDFTIFNLNATVGHDVSIDDFVNVAPGACISGNVHLGARCWIGTGAAINQGTPGEPLRIGADTVIGSGAVVVANCEAGGTYVGVPARKVQ